MTAQSHSNRPARVLLLAALLVVFLILAAPAEGFVYWANTGYGFSGHFAIGHANLGGSGVNLDFFRLPGISGTVTAASGVAVDASHVYWMSSGVGRANLDGTSAKSRRS